MLLEAARRARWAIWARVSGVVGWVEGEAVAMRILEGAMFAVLSMSLRSGLGVGVGVVVSCCGGGGGAVGRTGYLFGLLYVGAELAEQVREYRETMDTRGLSGVLYELKRGKLIKLFPCG